MKSKYVQTIVKITIVLCSTILIGFFLKNGIKKIPINGQNVNPMILNFLLIKYIIVLEFEESEILNNRKAR